MILFRKGDLVPRRFSGLVHPNLPTQDLPEVSTEFSVPRSLGPFATPERKRTISPDDLELFRLLCGLSGLTPGKMFRRMVRDEARRQIGTVAKNRASQNTAQAEAERLFAKTGQRTPVYAAPKGQS